MPNSWSDAPQQRGYYQGPFRQRPHGRENENEKRKRSVVIMNLQQLSNATETECRDQDHLAALDIARYLGIDDDIPKINVKRSRNGGHLIVTLETVESRDKLLQRAHFLGRNEPTRHLKLEKAYTAEDMIQRYGHLPSGVELDDPHSEVNIRRNHNGQFTRNNNFGGYRDNRSRTSSHNYDIPPHDNQFRRNQNDNRGRGGYSRNRGDNRPNEYAPPSNRGGFRHSYRDPGNVRNYEDDSYDNYRHNNRNPNHRYNNDEVQWNRGGDRYDGSSLRRNNNSRGNPRGGPRGSISHR